MNNFLKIQDCQAKQLITKKEKKKKKVKKGDTWEWAEKVRGISVLTECKS